MSRTDVAPWTVFSATSLGVVAVFLNISGTTVALPTITRELDATALQASWVLLSYMLLTTALILVFGRLSDMVGRRPLYLAGLAVLTVATLACALAPTIEVLLGARVLQAVGAAAVVTNTTALLTDVYPPRSLGRALGANATTAAVAQMVGPVVGGAATSAFGWRGTFWVCVPLCVLALAWSVVVVHPPRTRPAVRERFDVAGAVLSVLVLTAVVVALSPVPGSGSGRAVLLGLAALAGLVGFLVLQSRREHPLVDLGLFADRARAVTYAAVFLSACSQYALVVLASLYVQATQGVDPLRAGLLVSPVAVGTVLAAATVGFLVHRVQPRTLTVLGLALSAAGLAAFTVAVGLADPYPVLLPGLLLVGLGTGTFMTPSTSALMLAVGRQRRGIANGVRSALQNVGYLLSTAVALAVATQGLDAATRRAAYAGSLADAGTVAPFVSGVRAAGVVLTALAALGALVCLALPHTDLGAPTDPDPDSDDHPGTPIPAPAGRMEHR